MSTSPRNLISAALRERRDASTFEISEALAQLYPELAVVETEESAFNLGRYSWAGQCETSYVEEIHSQTTLKHLPAKKSVYTVPFNSWQKVKWFGREFDVITMTVSGYMCDRKRYFVVGSSKEVVEHFIFACCEWNSAVRSEILVFSGGWQKDEELFNSIRATSLESLILEAGLKEEIETDFRSFFEAKEFYAKHGVPWKRGVLFLGPPGNGKTHAIKGLVNLLGKPCLSVRSLKHKYQTEHQMITDVFRRARSTAPCLLVFEDLDTLLNDGNRSFFLNELDGFAANEGIMTIATANYPERLDPAILHRPSRFDRKYTFNLPGEEERVRYLALQNSALGNELSLSEPDILELARLTEEFSFAYLKELVLSSMMRWIASPQIAMAEVMKGQLDMLRLQMKTPPPVARPQRTV